MGNQPMKEKCDGNCRTCPILWQIQCTTQLTFKNSQNQKNIEDKMDIIMSKINDVFGTEELNSGPAPQENEEAPNAPA